MRKVKQIEFNSTPSSQKLMERWKKENTNKIVIIGNVKSQYKPKTISGKRKQSNIEIITIFYKEK